MIKKRVAVLRGGPSSEYEVSLKTGASVLKYLPEKYEGIDLLIDKEGIWHIGGVPIHPKDLLSKADVVFNAMHGEYGEDGKVQKILERFNIPFTGSGSLASALGMNKALSKEIFKKHGIKTAAYKTFDKKEYSPTLAVEIFKTFPQPSVVKPLSAGSSVGVSIVRSVADMKEAMEKAFSVGEKIIIEEFIQGKEATCGVLENFRGKKFYSLIPIEIVPQKDQKFYDYEAKYSETKGADHICPGTFTKKESEEIEKLAIEIHKAIGARHYSRSDFIVNSKRGIYALEINTLPGMTAQSLLPDEIRAVGSTFGELLEHLIELALH